MSGYGATQVKCFAPGIATGLVLLLVGVLLLFSCERPPSRELAPAASQPTVDPQEVKRLVSLLGSVRSWPGTPGPDYTDEDWREAICAARAMQKADGKLVIKALDEYGGGPLQALRVIVVLRLMFDLPADAPASERRVFRGGWSVPIVDGRANLGWPIGWSDGKPSFIARVPSGALSTPTYHAAEEYEYLLGKYPFRDLSAWECEAMHRVSTQPGQ
jgi:hypothetical protein